MEFIGWLREVFLREWPAVRAAPWSFAVCAAVTGAVVGTVVWIVVSKLDEREIANYKSAIQVQDEQLAALRQNQAAVAASPPSQWRRLKDDERKRLLSAFSAEPKFKTMVVYAMADSEPRQYATQFIDILRTAGVEVLPRELPLSLPADVGVMVGTTTPANPSADAKRLVEILTSAGLSAHYTPWAKADDVPVDFDLFIGPKPW